MTTTTYLQPNFPSIPNALREIPHWVLWKDAKVPYCATALNSKASVIDPNSWASFDQTCTAYEEGGYTGVGIVLSGDGLVGVDLDHCVDHGHPNPAALVLLERIGCGYVELSPSGTGLRGFGQCHSMRQMKGIHGKLGNLSVELYAKAHYLTVTGHSIVNGGLVELGGFAEVANEIRGTDPQKRTEDDKSNLLYSSVHPLSSSVGIPNRTIPTQVGQRNSCLFELARYLRGAYPDLTIEQQRAVVLEWHRMAMPFIGTKDFAITWSDFRNGWEKVKHPTGHVLQSILGTIDSNAPIPDGILALGYGERTQHLVRICMALQRHQGNAEFFLSSRVAGTRLGICFSDAAKMLVVLVQDRVLELVTKGAGFKASRYRFIWGEGAQMP